MPFKLNRQALAVLSCFLPLAAAAQTDNSVSRLDDIVVTASRTAQLEKDVIGDVTVIKKEDLQKEGQNSVAEILAKQPGIQFYSNGGPQTATGVMLRGNEPRHTLVLIDGIRVNSMITSVTNWNAIDPATIERIEVIRGAASSLYGSDAIGGVVNIITKKTGEDRPLSAWGNIGYGSNDTFKSSAGISGAQDGWDYALSSSLAESGGFNATRRPEKPTAFDMYNKDDDGYTQRSLNASLGYRWQAGHHIGLTAYNGYMNGDYDAGSDPRRAYAITRQQAYSITSTDDITDAWQSVLRFGYSKEFVDSRSVDSFTGEFGSGTLGSQQKSYSWQNNLKFSENQNVSLILERLEERPGSSSEFTINQRNTNSAGLVYRGDFDRHHLQASVRNDNISGYGNQATGGLAYDLDLNDQWRVGVAGNTGFRAPSFTELYSPLNFGFVGNPDLAPEKSRNIEASIRYTSDTTRLSAVAYQNKVRQLIDGYVCFLDCGGFNGSYHAENVDSATLRGLSLEAEQDIGRTTLRAGADFLNPRNDKTGDQLRWRARQVYRLSVDHRFDALRVGAEYQFTGKRYNDADNKVSIGGYGLYNLTAAYDFSKHAGVQVRWNNLFNKDYTNVHGYNMPGSNVFVNFSFRM
ncbi:TonB-dependent receptor domain-containing protein [Pollutimonas sp. M17]|uniref:TonB-dependent receptor domain-containing protein n=1 Tax=Pollutimonas sp. M17 TaxID=2962065 RepID=UPI0021F4ED3A|nr:TonB-dependent receptor [Pollutimonas sp. M17]UYO93378.1 TonB-dependent receptor [Pollutimonas sp. M17]HWK71828.1 TonB-dependent receptor [Burkholderiaceae bacterium]